MLSSNTWPRQKYRYNCWNPKAQTQVLYHQIPYRNHKSEGGSHIQLTAGHCDHIRLDENFGEIC